MSQIDKVSRYHDERWVAASRAALLTGPATLTWVTEEPPFTPDGAAVNVVVDFPVRGAHRLYLEGQRVAPSEYAVAGRTFTLSWAPSADVRADQIVIDYERDPNAPATDHDPVTFPRRRRRRELSTNPRRQRRRTPGWMT